MATTAVFVRNVKAIPCLTVEYQVSSIRAGEKVSLSHDGPSGVVPAAVRMVRVVTAATAGSPVFVQFEGYDSSADTVDIRFDTEPGGDLTGAVVMVEVDFLAQASGGLTNVA